MPRTSSLAQRLLLPREICANSCFRTVPSLDDLENYVYEAEGGKGIYVYHIERVSLKRIPWLRMALIIDKGHKL